MNKPCFIFYDGQVLLSQIENGFDLPDEAAFTVLSLMLSRQRTMAHADNNAMLIGELNDTPVLPAPFCMVPLREAFEQLDRATCQLIGKASQILHWDNTNQYCGKCGGKNNDSAHELAKICSECGYVVYSRISPSMIVLVTRGDDLLLARGPHFPPGIYSTLAGFIEPGETVEEAVHREVREEVSIDIKNLHYFSSQPWPFPHSLMLGYFAEYASGEINIDGVEIEAANWFHKDKLPRLGSHISIARQLIEAFLSTRG